MQKPFPILVVLLLLALSACQSSSPGLENWMFEMTGEEGLPRQVKGMAQWATDVLHPQPDTAPDVPVAYAGVNPFGINVFLNQEVEPEKRERSVQMIADAGFHWLRQEFPWEDIEIHGKGDFEDRRHEPYRSAWIKYDHIVDLAEQYGLEVIPRLSNPPAWTRALTDTAGAFAPPDDLTDWGDYVYAVVSRYRGRIHVYQLWNEPNLYPEWGSRPVDPEGYTQLLCEGYARAKEADPDVVIVSGALGPTVDLSGGDRPGTGMNDFVFLQRMYDAGAAECFDIMAVNDYMLWSGPTDRRMRPLNINFSRPVYIRDIMVANGDAHKPIWISEMSANAPPADSTGIAGWGAYGTWSLEQQARYVPLAYRRAIEEWPWVGVVNYWFFKPVDDREQDQAVYYFRMVEPDFTPLPVYDAMQAYTTDLTPALYPGYHQEDHWALVYEGEWANGRMDEWANGRMGGYRWAGGDGAAVRFVYEGAGLELVPGPDAGEIEVRVDGGAARRVALSGDPVRLAGGVSRTRHEVTLVAVAGEVGIDAFVVRRAWSPPLWLIVGAIGALAFLVYIVRRR